MDHSENVRDRDRYIAALRRLAIDILGYPTQRHFYPNIS